MDNLKKQRIVEITLEKRIGTTHFAVINFKNENNVTIIDTLKNRTRGVLVNVEKHLLYGLTKLYNRRSYQWVCFDNLTEEMQEKIYQHLFEK